MEDFIMSVKEKKHKIDLDSIRKSKWSYIAASAVFIILGLMLIIDPAGTGKKLAFLFGGALAAYGTFRLVSSLIKNKGDKNISSDIIIGILLIIGGLAVIVFHGYMAELLSFALGIFLIADGLFKLQTAVNAKCSLIASWWLVLTAALVCIAFGALLIFAPSFRLNTPYLALGIALLIDGAQNLISAIYSHMIVKNAPKDAIDINDHAPVETRAID